MPLTAPALLPVLSDLRYAIDRRVSLAPRTVVYLEAGHYSGTHGPDEFSLRSQTHALDLGTSLVLDYQKRLKLVYGIFKDDLGLTCDAVSCYVPAAQETDDADLSIPRALESVLVSHPLVKMDKLMLFSERNAKNRGLAYLKRLKQSGVYPPGMAFRATDDGEAFVYRTYDRQEVTLAEVNGTHWTAKCPVLMGQHYADVLLKLAQRFPAEYPVVLADFSDLMDRNKVTRGSEAALRYFRRSGMAEVTILNVFYDDPEGEGFIIDEFRSSDF